MLVSDAPGKRVAIANRADGGIFYWLGKLYGFAVIVLIWTFAVVGVSCYAQFASIAPKPPDLRNYSAEVPGVTRIYAADGTLLGEFATEWREVTAYEQFPQILIDAFVATEDHDFFEHSGISFRGIARAAWANITAGDFAQGGSTITQQVAKQFLGNEKSLDRKAKEAILARRLEARYSKKAILSVYMNQIYLGNGAYGVAAAAQRYFSKQLPELDLGEAALIAGLAQAPSRYDPVRHPDRALERRNDVLDRMARYGYLDPAEAESWKSKPLTLNTPDDVYPDRLPYYTEHVRRQVIEDLGSRQLAGIDLTGLPFYDSGLRRHIINELGSEILLEDGLTIETAVQPVVDAAAYENVDFGARKQDKRQGWRGPEAFLEGGARETFLERADKLYGKDPLEPGRRYLALVEEVGSRGAKVAIGSQTYELPLRNMNWASSWSRREAINDVVIDNAREALKVGDVVWVSKAPIELGKFRDWHMPDGHNPKWKSPVSEEKMRRRHDDLDREVQLEQVPHPQEAIFTADHETGYVLSLVGGFDFHRSVFNRAVQACRQPGSTYKPIYYSAALDEGYGFDTLLEDKPIQIVDEVTGEVWTPANLGGTLDNQVTLEYALVFSKNLPAVHIFSKVGADNVEKWARRLGFTTTIIADKALALGASCTVLPELTRAFAIFARNGRWVDWVYVRRIRDRTGELLADNTVYYDPMLAPADRLDRLHATAGREPKQAIPARAAYLTSKLLRQAMKYGFAGIVRATGINSAGKTGTSSATMDTSFVGYTSRWITTVWMGDDMRQRPLGKDDAAYMTVVPLWSRYMAELTGEHPNEEIPWEVPEGVNPKDRGEHSKGETGARSDLVYKKSKVPATEVDPTTVPPAGSTGG